MSYAIKTTGIRLASVALLILTLQPVTAGEQLPMEEQERLRRIVTMKRTRLTDADEIKKAVAIAADIGSPEVLEGAINNPDPFAGMCALELFPKSHLIPSEKRRILLTALLNQSIWPNDYRSSNDRDRRAELGWLGVVETRDKFFREAILDAFGRKIERQDLNWGSSEETRMALAKEIGGPEVVAALSPPNGARRVGPWQKRDAEIPGKEGGNPANPAGSAAKATESTPSFGGWAPWAGIAATLAAAAGWLLLRKMGRGGKQ